MSGYAKISHFSQLIIFFSIIASIITHPRFAHGVVVENESTLVPLLEPGMMNKMVFNESRRRLGSFRICALCTCCGAKGPCFPSPCCYAINCNIPNRPFGFCSFTPKTCNCIGCHI
ncbi:hypothetical protein Scep_011057 [Stephania cephalantha]|uniref:DUF7866 domain-containing protein n=1 Tax=Stephania cephalantha TaxID=152367 RepID=A0AAP0JWJ5_9MAGN